MSVRIGRSTTGRFTLTRTETDADGTHRLTVSFHVRPLTTDRAGIIAAARCGIRVRDVNDRPDGIRFIVTGSVLGARRSAWVVRELLSA